MGLLYVFPVSLEEKDFVKLDDQSITLKTYGLPYLFWGYAVAILVVLVFMFLAIKDPILKLVALGDDTDATLGYSLLFFLGLLPVFLFSFFFYEKRITRNKEFIGFEYRLFGIKIFSEKFYPAPTLIFEISPYLSSPNLARLKGGEETTGFQNKGYFILWLNTKEGKKIALDRHSRKSDLMKLQQLLEMIS